MEENEVIYPIYSDTEEQFDEVAWGSYFKTYCHYSYLSCDDIITVSLW